MKILLNKIADNFGCGEMSDVARNVLERVYDNGDETDAGEAVSQAMDDELIYTADQWTVIAYYSDPSDPKSFSEACEEFFGDLLECIDEEGE